MKKFFKFIFVVIIIVIIIKMGGEILLRPEQFSTTAQYHLINDIKNGDKIALHIYEDHYLSQGWHIEGNQLKKIK